MLKLTKTGIGLLTRQYRSVLHKCWLINVGLWQAMGDAVSKAVSVPARLVASLLSGGALNGEAFNALDEILLNRLFERKLASLTAIGLTIAAATMPNKAEAAMDLTEDDVSGKVYQNYSNEGWGGVYFIGNPDNHSILASFINNRSENEGGAIFVQDSGIIPSITEDGVVNKIEGTFKNNSAARYGGAISVWGTVSLIDGHFEGNSADANSGGAVVAGANGLIKSVKGEFINNSAPEGRGGAVYNDASINNISALFTKNHAAQGGAIANVSAGPAIIDSIYSSTFLGNYAVENENFAASGGAIFNNDKIKNISDVTFIGNYATADTGTASAGAVYNSGTITSIGSADNPVLFQDNYATSTSDSAQGGAIYNEGMIGSIYADFIGNKAVSTNNSARGGAIYNAGTMTVRNSLFKDNIASDPIGAQAGGAIYNGNKITILDSIFDNNRNLGGAGGALVSMGEVKTRIVNSSFQNNLSFDNGGSINQNGDGFLEILNSTFTANQTYVEGGAVAFNGTAVIKNSTFTNNTANEGGALYPSGGTLILIDSTVSNNTALTIVGGGMFNNGAIATIIASSSDTIFKNNVNSANYNDIYNLGLINLNAAQNKSISFGGTILNKNIININKSELTYQDMNDDYTLTEKSITQTGGNYIFNNAISGGNVNIYNGANIKFSSLLQDNNTTSYGSFALTSLTNDSNGGYIDMRNSHIENNSATTLTLGSQLKIGIDLQHPTTGTTGLVDNITYTTGSGSILIDAINELGTRPTATGTYLYQVLNGSGVSLALTDAIKTEWNTDTTTSSPKVRDPIPATTAWTDKIYNRWTDTRVQGSLDVSGNNLVYSVINTQTAQSEVAGDTLALVTTATNNASRIFSTTDATAEYLLSTNLGAVNAVYKNLSINGTVSGNNRSTLNLGNYNGFYLDSSDDSLSLNNMAVSGGTDYSVNLANSGSSLSVENVTMNSGSAPIVGSGNATFTGTNEINTKVLNTGTTTVSSGTTDFNDEVAGFTVSAPATVSIAADDITAETTNNGTLELEGGNVTTKLMGTGRMKLMSGNVRLLSSTPPATTGSLSFGSSSDYADSILTSSSADSTSDHALVTAGYLDNNYYMNYGDSMTKSFTKAVNDNHKSVIVRSAKHDVTIFGRKSDNTATTTKQAA